MEIKYKAKRDNVIIETVSIPTSPEMKMKIDKIRMQKKVDFNEMTRDFWDKLIKVSSQAQ